MRRALPFLLLLGAMLSGCGDGDPVGPPLPDGDFSIEAVPERMSWDAIPGQVCVYLVTVENLGPGGSGRVDLAASAAGAEVAVEPASIAPGQVAEMRVVPGASAAGATLAVTLAGVRGAFSHERLVDLPVRAGEDGLAAEAAAMRDLFVPWLEANRPELGITASTPWEGSIVRPGILVVMHYLYFSDEWEMGLMWHVMIPPHDWARIYLRRRYVETAPSLAFEIPSWHEPGAPVPIQPPAEVDR